MSNPVEPKKGSELARFLISDMWFGVQCLAVYLTVSNFLLEFSRSIRTVLFCAIIMFVSRQFMKFYEK
jgi:hypothetical protein